MTLHGKADTNAFHAIRLSGYGIRLNARVNRLLSVYNRFSRPFYGKALVSVFPWRVTCVFKFKKKKKVCCLGIFT